MRTTKWIFVLLQCPVWTCTELEGHASKCSLWRQIQVVSLCFWLTAPWRQTITTKADRSRWIHVGTKARIKRLYARVALFCEGKSQNKRCENRAVLVGLVKRILPSSWLSRIRHGMKWRFRGEYKTWNSLWTDPLFSLPIWKILSSNNLVMNCSIYLTRIKLT